MNKAIMIIIIKTLWFIVSPPLQKAQEGTRSIQLTSWLYHSSTCLFNNLARIAEITPPTAAIRTNFRIIFPMPNLTYATQSSVHQQVSPVLQQLTSFLGYPTMKSTGRGFPPSEVDVCRPILPPGRVGLQLFYINYSNAKIATNSAKVPCLPSQNQRASYFGQKKEANKGNCLCWLLFPYALQWC